MNRKLDLSQLSVPQLKAVRAILVGGTTAEADTQSKAGKLARALKEENAELKRENKWREIVESYNLEFDEPKYWLSFSTEDRLRWVCQKLSNAMKEAKAEAKPIMKIPQMVRAVELEGIEGVRAELRNRRSRG